MLTKFASVADYFLFRSLLYDKLAQDIEMLAQSPDSLGASKHYTFDKYLEQLCSPDEALVLFLSSIGVFGYGFITALPQGLTVHSAFFKEEFYDAYTSVEIFSSIGKCLGCMPRTVIFECNKSNITFGTDSKNRYANELLASCVQKQRRLIQEHYGEIDRVVQQLNISTLTDRQLSRIAYLKNMIRNEFEAVE